jgi:hypothetical protein
LTIVSSQSVLKERSLKKILLSVLVLLIAAAAGLFAYLPLKKPDMAESSAIRASKAPRNASLAAIYAYLKTLRPVVNAVETKPSVTEQKKGKS